MLKSKDAFEIRQRFDSWHGHKKVIWFIGYLWDDIKHFCISYTYGLMLIVLCTLEQRIMSSNAKRLIDNLLTAKTDLENAFVNNTDDKNILFEKLKKAGQEASQWISHGYLTAGERKELLRVFMIVDKYVLAIGKVLNKGE